jgi:protein-S-isoprenylcysteine O-methyltransferase Ste14
MEIKTEIIKSKVHRILAHSYMVYLIALFFGLIFSAIWPFPIFNSEILAVISAIFLFLSSLLIFWAQKSSREFTKENLTKESFMKGPYRFTRNPTNIGLFFSMICFSIIVNSIFSVLFTFVAFLLSLLIFLKKEEDFLANKYGIPYLEYKKIVKF